MSRTYSRDMPARASTKRPRSHPQHLEQILVGIAGTGDAGHVVDRIAPEAARVLEQLDQPLSSAPS